MLKSHELRNRNRSSLLYEDQENAANIGLNSDQEHTANVGPNTDQAEIASRFRELDEVSRRSIIISIILSLFVLSLSIVWSILCNRLESESIPTYVCWLISIVTGILFITSIVIELCNRRRISLAREIESSYMRTRQRAMKIIAFASGLNAIGVGTTVLVDQYKSGVPILVYRLVLFFCLFGLTFYTYRLVLNYSNLTDDIIISRDIMNTLIELRSTNQNDDS